MSSPARLHEEAALSPSQAPSPQPSAARAPLRLDRAAVIALQRTAGNASVSLLLSGRACAPASARPADTRHREGDAAISAALARTPAAKDAPAPASAEGEVRVVERRPTFPEPGVKYVIAGSDRGYTFEVEVEGKPTLYANLNAAQAIEKLRLLWRIVHSDLNDGRAENLALQAMRKEHRITGFWSDLAAAPLSGGIDVPDPAMWDEVGRGTLSQVLTVLDRADAFLKQWEAHRQLENDPDPTFARSPFKSNELLHDPTEDSIKQAAALLGQAAHELVEREKRLDAYRADTAKGARRMVTGIKVYVTALTAAAGGGAAQFAGKGAGMAAQAAYSAGTLGVLGAADEAATQLGEIRIGERERFDVARIGKRAARDVVTGFVGGVVGGKFSQVLKSRLGPWISGLSDEAIAASGLTREQLLSNSQRLFAEWVAGSVAVSPFTTTAGHLMDLALDGKLKVKIDTFGDFAANVLDDMIANAKMGAFLTGAGHLMDGSAGTGARAGRDDPSGRGSRRAGAGEPVRPSTGNPRPPKSHEASAMEYVQPEAGHPRPPKSHETSATDYVKPPGRRTSTGHPKPPKPPVIVQSPPGGFEPSARQPLRDDDHGPPPVQVELVPTEAMPKPESRNMADPGKTRHVHKSVVEVERAVRDALKRADEEAMKLDKNRRGPREIDGLIAEIANTDPQFAEKARRYYEKTGDPKWVEEQMVHLWEQAAEHECTVAEELEHRLGSRTKGVNRFRNTAGADTNASYAEFKTTLKDARPLVDESSAGDHHGAHTHAFQQYLGDQLFGPGEGLAFRQKLAEFKGPSRLRRTGHGDSFEEPFWAQVWDELFDASGNLHSPEVIGKILQEHLDFPRWDPGAP